MEHGEVIFKMRYGRRSGKSTLFRQLMDAGVPVLSLKPEVMLAVDYGHTEAVVLAAMSSHSGHVYILDDNIPDIEQMKKTLIERFTQQESVAEELPKRRRKSKGERKRNAWGLR